jgi:hypothetical protein
MRPFHFPKYPKADKKTLKNGKLRQKIPAANSHLENKSRCLLDSLAGKLKALVKEAPKPQSKNAASAQEFS